MDSPPKTLTTQNLGGYSAPIRPPTKHLSCKQAAHAWGIRPEKATQAGDPAFAKVAAALLLYPHETMAELAAWMGALARDAPPQPPFASEPMTEKELERRRSFQRGRFPVDTP